MNEHELKIKIAGHGGQGIVLAGNILARACMTEGKHVTGMVSYGAEMRGGTANATLVISDEEIASPVVEYPNAALFLNQPSLDLFEDRLVPGGRILLNTSMIQREPHRQDIEIGHIEATRIARDCGDDRVANIVALGAFVRMLSVVTPESVRVAIETLFSMKNRKMIDINLKAFEQGISRCELPAMR